MVDPIDDAFYNGLASLDAEVRGDQLHVVVTFERDLGPFDPSTQFELYIDADQDPSTGDARPAAPRDRTTR